MRVADQHLTGRQILLLLLSLALVSLLAAAPGHAQDTRPRILTIIESDSRLPLVQSILGGLEAGLGPELTMQGEFLVEYLNLLQFGRPEERAHIRDFLTARYGGTDLSAIAVIGPNALTFLRDHRDAIAPDVPVIFGGITANGLDQVLGDTIEPAMSGVLSAFDISPTLDLALTLQPNAPEIVVLTGSAPYDLQFRAMANAVLGDTYADRPVRFIPEGTADAMLAEAAALDPRSILLYLSVVIDAEGNRFIPSQFVRDLVSVTEAPVWTIYETMLGTGVVGGSFEELAATGQAMADLIRVAVDGDLLPPLIEVSDTPMADWAALKSHGLDPGLLPPGTRIINYVPTLWERYRVAIVTISAIIAAQALTIAALVVNRRRLILSQETLASERAQLVHVSRNLRLGQLSAALAHEINQPLAAIQANADAGARLATRTPPDHAEIMEIFNDITRDVDRAAGTIATLRRLIVKGETTFDSVDLNDIVTATLALAANELTARGAQVRTDLAPDRLVVRGNGPQLQQIVLNLAFNAAEAMVDLPQAARIVRIATARQPDGSAALTVADAGPGVPPERREDLFRPFVSSKTSGLGVGLAICRNIAVAHGGTLAFTNPRDGGARLQLTLPPDETPA